MYTKIRGISDLLEDADPPAPCQKPHGFQQLLSWCCCHQSRNFFMTPSWIDNYGNYGEYLMTVTSCSIAYKCAFLTSSSNKKEGHFASILSNSKNATPRQKLRRLESPFHASRFGTPSIENPSPSVKAYRNPPWMYENPGNTPRSLIYIYIHSL